MIPLLAALIAAPAGAPAVATPVAPEPAPAVYSQVRPSVVRIDSAGGVGAGFVFHTRRHVATALHVVAAGRPIQVRAPGGEPRAARVVATEPDHDLAILLLEAPIEDATPLAPPEPFSPVIGQRAYVIGHPFAPQAALDRRLSGLLDWSLSAGLVSAFNPDVIQVDAPVNPGNSGGPVVDEQGRLLGVVSFEIRQSDGPGFAIAAPRLTELVSEIDEEMSYWGAWSFNAGFGWGMQLTGAGPTNGPVTSLELVAWDRLALRVASGDLDRPLDNERGFPQTTLEHSYLELGAAWRFLFVVGNLAPLYVVLGGGTTYELRTERQWTRFVQFTDPGCPGSATGNPCETRVTYERSPTSEMGWGPYGSLALRVGPLDLRYSMGFALGSGADASHRLTAGLML